MNKTDFTSLEILYEDNHLLILNKKAGDLSQGDQTGDTCLRTQLMHYLKVMYEKPGNVYLGVPHRLDRPTSGALIFCKTSKALTRVQKAFAERKVTKKYWAIVQTRSKLNLEGTLTDFLWKDSSLNKSFVGKAHQNKVKKAVLNYRVIQKNGPYQLIEVELITGRHHQIRVQLSNAGFPIVGDLKYGYPTPNSDKSIALHARSISFKHPTKEEILEITAPLPLWNGWDIFRNT